MVDLTFFEKRSSNLLLYIIIIAIVLLLLYMVWPWKTALILTLWAAYVLWWPTVWLEKYIHRRGLAALIVIIVTGVLMAFALVNVTVIVAQQIAEIAAGASASSNATLSQGITNTFQLANPDLAKTGPVLARVSALATGGGIITTTFTQGAHGIVRNVLISIPLLLAQLIIVFFLLLGILAKGDVIVKDFVGAVPAKHRSIVNRFLKHLNPIYYTFFVIYVAVAVVCAILAAIIYGILGVPFFATFAVFILFIGLIPSVGRALIYIPLTIWLLIQGQTVTALLVLITSIVVFELILRYTIQPRWMERTGKVPKTLTLIAFTFALAAFGFIGFAIGPAIVGFALAMWRTYKDIQREQEEQAPAIAQASGS
ncbi:MAG: AI-2E family transporter [Euryarchaeota archaeon]